MRFVKRLCRSGKGKRCEHSRERISKSEVVFEPSHWRAFSVVGRAAMRSKSFAGEVILETRVSGSSIWIVMRERNWICGYSGKGFEEIGFV
jgi:hypothetical protein